MSYYNPNEFDIFHPSKKLSRRQFIKYVFLMTAAGFSLSNFPANAYALPTGILTRRIPKTGEQIPAIGMGTWQTFHVGNDPQLRKLRTDVLRTFFEMGGGMVDSSPMYGTSEEVIGHALRNISNADTLFSATKIWTPVKTHGISQLKNSHHLWGENKFDLLQIHNLLSWEEHLETLLEWKQQGLVRYIGITTSHGRRHKLFEKVMKKAPIDFVQFTYNIIDREAEKRLLPIAAEHNLAVIINRPFQCGGLFERFERAALPDWADEIDCHNWAQFFLKFIIAHPAVTCAIPATSRVDHMKENMGALKGRLPDQATRKRMIKYMSRI